MADYKFDGKYFVDRNSKRLAEIDGNYLKNYSNSRESPKLMAITSRIILTQNVSLKLMVIRLRITPILKRFAQ